MITHRISAEDCQSRQRSHFHKCHRCIYRGKASDWVLEENQLRKKSGGVAATNGVAAKAPVKAPEPVVQAPVGTPVEAAQGEAGTGA